MDFYNKIAFIGLISLPIIIAMYMLKEKNKNVIVPSLYLWQMAVDDNNSSTAIKKLKKNLLMFLQLLAALLLVMAIARPYILTDKLSTDYVIVVDCGLSMNAADIDGGRLTEAKKLSVKMVDNSAPDTRYTVIKMDSNPSILISDSSDKSEVRDKIGELEATYEVSDTEATVELIKMVCENKDANVYVFSDEKIDIDGIAVNNIIIGESVDNIGITNLSHNIDGSRIVVMVKVKNYGEKGVNKNVNLYADGKLYDYKEVNIAPGDEATVLFTEVENNDRELMATLTPEDYLNADDVRYDAVTDSTENRVYLYTKQNAFLESALSVLPNINIYKGKELDNLSGYGWYVFDGEVPENMPADGHILLINPNPNELIEVGEEVDISNVRIKEAELLEFISDIKFDISKSRKIKIPDWGYEILGSEETPLMIAGERGQQKIAVLGFDLHNTDLPLKKDFPIFIYNLYNWFMPEDITAENDIGVGDSVKFNIMPEATEVRLIDADNNIEKIAPPFPVDDYRIKGKSGIYLLEQTIGENKRYDKFAVNVKNSDESRLIRDNISNDSTEDIVGSIKVNKDLQRILIILLLIVLLIEFGIYIYNLGKIPAGLILGLRGTIIVLLIISLLNLRINISGDNVTTIFAIDRSQSIADKQQDMLQFINEAVKNKGANDYVGVISYGKSTGIESGVTEESKEYAINADIENDYTNIAKAMELGNSMFNESANKRLVLLTDGRENMGSAQETAKRLGMNSVEIDVVKYTDDISEEVQLTDINLPKYIKKGNTYALEVNIDSLISTQCRLTIYKQNNTIYNGDIEVTAGENNFVIKDIADVTGGIIYRAEIGPVNDTMYQNNKAYGYAYVEDIPKVLVIEQNNSGEEMVKILSAANVTVSKAEAVNVPTDIDILSTYDAIVIADCAIDDMNDGLPEALKSYVQNTAGGLLVTGGENSFALGDYKDTELETILPVSMELSDKEKDGDLGMIIVMDRSGSMSSGNYGITKLELAKEAIIRSVENLTEKDSLGILAFDDGYDWIVNLEKTDGNVDNIISKTSGITEGGGTSILPALQEAYSVLTKSDNKIKHIILMTDGQAEKDGYTRLVESMRKDNITLSTVAVGSDADTSLLENLAQKGNGRYYYTNEFTDLPKIFAKETNMAGKKYINNETFNPQVESGNEILKGIEYMPSLDGYIATTGKASADIILNYDEKTPILASWQYGLGKTAVFTSDMEKWCNNWLSGEEGVNILRNTVNYVLRRQSSVNSDILFEVKGEQSELTVKLKDGENIESISGNLVGDNYKEDIVFERTSPNEFKAITKVNTEGSYVANLTISGSGTKSFVTTGVSIPYSKEYDIREMDNGDYLIDRIIQLGNGRIIESAEDVFRTMNTKVKEKKSLSWILLLYGLILLLIEIAIRRFGFITEKVKSIFKADRKILAEKIEEETNNENAQKIPKKEPNKSNEKNREDVQENKSAVTTSSLLLKNKRNRRNGDN